LAESVRRAPHWLDPARTARLECSPKADPGVMRVPAAWTAGRILDERQASQPRADHQEAA
jgi:hypothetical protein